MSLLDTLSLPHDLKKLSRSELETLASEIRVRLLEIGAACGGHLASNLGVVELTLALHVVFDSPKDKTIWDTSHQTYVHKMLTGRLSQMFTIRQDDGLSGFSNIFESEHDIFGAGHASTALSAALGVAHAREITQEQYSVISVIGDASLSGGMAFEALNNVKKLNANFICILNDNDMSISRPVGTMADYMTRIRTSPGYNQAKHKFESILDKIPRIGVPLKKRIEKVVERLRDIVLDVPVGVLFEEFGFRYLGPLDGHNISVVMAALKYAKTYPGPIMIHIMTTKGKGHSPAELDPIQYHGIAPQKKVSAAVKVEPKVKTFTQVFGDEVVALGQQDPKLVVITPAMKEGSGLNKFADAFPDRFFDVGIAEEHAVTFSAGLARAGVKPLLSIYSTFLQRGYDQVIHDVCIQKLPVIFALDRAGFVGEDGQTHHGVFDMAFLLPIPNIHVLAPKDGAELQVMLRWAINQNLPVSIRYPKGPVPVQDGTISTPVELATAEVMVELSEKSPKQFEILLIGVGSMAWPAHEAALVLQEYHVSCAVINLRFVKPLDVDLLTRYITKSKHVLVIEEGVGIGGVFSHLLGSLHHLEKSLSEWHHLAIPDTFVDHGKMQTLRQAHGLTKKGIVEKVSRIVRETHPQQA